MKFNNISEFLQYIIENPKNENIENWTSVFNAMTVHTRMRIPSDLLLSRRPNEEQQIYEYRLTNYEPITYGSMNRAVNNLYRFFSGLSYSINASDNLLKLLNENIFDGYNFKNYMEQIVLTRMIEDPNGVLLILPSGDGLKDITTQVDINPILVYSTQIIYKDNNYFAFNSEYKVTYLDLNNKAVTGNIIYAFDKENYYQFIPIAETKSGIEYQIKTIYNHKLKRIPAITLGGNLNADNYFDSFFSSYLAFGNEAIRQFSDWQAIMVTSAFPYREELATDCDYIGCESGWIINNEGRTHCPSCKGIGKKINKSPYGVYVRSLPSSLNESKDDFSIPSLRFISPDVSIVEYSQRAWELLIDKAEKTLALNFINEAQSGIAKDIDRDELYALLTRIGNNFFDSLMLDALNIIEGYININNPGKISLIKPFSFKIKSETEIIEEISTLINNKAPAIFVSMSVFELAKKKFDGNKLNMKIFESLMLWDKLAVYNNEEKINMVASGSVSDDNYIKSIYAYPLIIQLINEVTQNEFMNMNFDVISNKLDEMIKPYIIEKVEIVDNSGNKV